MEKKEEEIVVVASSLCKEYQVNGHTINALKNVNFKVAEGKFVCIYGPSGAGKTTLLNIIGNFPQFIHWICLSILQSYFHINCH